MRLYRRHDLDLLFLYDNPNFNFQKKVKYVLKDFVKNNGFNNKTVSIEIPPYDVNTCNYTDLRGYVQIHIYLSPQKDKDIINFIKSIKTGFRNSTVKNIFRNYLSRPAVYATLTAKPTNDNDVETMDSTEKILENMFEYN